MFSKIKKLWNDESGLAMVEYIIILAVLVVAGIVIFRVIRTRQIRAAHHITEEMDKMYGKPEEW